MLRRDPTRIEMQLDNINEWNAVKNEKLKANSEHSTTHGFITFE